MVLDSGRLVEDKGILMEYPFRLQRVILSIKDVMKHLPVFLQYGIRLLPVEADALQGCVKQPAILKIIHIR